MEVLRFGSRGDEVEKWQHFLRGIGLYLHGVDGYFGADTQRATETFQRHHGLKDDGIVGNRTLGEAMRVGFSAVEDDPAAPGSLDVPAKPPFASLDAAGRVAAFGSYPFRPAHVPDNPEAIVITSGWVGESIVDVNIPQLAGVIGASSTGRAQFHRLVDRAWASCHWRAGRREFLAPRVTSLLSE